MPTSGADVARADDQHVFVALADPTRRHVLERLAALGPQTITALAAELPISRQALTKHLRTLGDANLVTVRRAGRERRYELAPDALTVARRWLDALGATWARRLQALQRHLAAADERRNEAPTDEPGDGPGA